MATCYTGDTTKRLTRSIYIKYVIFICKKSVSSLYLKTPNNYLAMLISYFKASQRTFIIICKNNFGLTEFNTIGGATTVELVTIIDMTCGHRYTS